MKCVLSPTAVRAPAYAPKQTRDMMIVGNFVSCSSYGSCWSSRDVSIERQRPIKKVDILKRARYPLVAVAINMLTAIRYASSRARRTCQYRFCTRSMATKPPFNEPSKNPIAKNAATTSASFCVNQNRRGK